MTAAEINTQFDILYNNLTNYEGASFTPKEKSMLLTYAQIVIIRKYYPIADQTEKYRRFLLPLKISDYSCTLVSAVGNHYRFLMPEELDYVLSENATQVFNSNSICPIPGYSRVWNNIKSITDDYYGVNIINPFKKPYNELIWKLDRFDETKGRLVELVSDDTYSITTYEVTYYKHAKPIIVPGTYTSGTIRGVNFTGNNAGMTSEVDDLHDEIIQEAVRIATSSTRDQVGYQIQNIEKTLK